MGKSVKKDFEEDIAERKPKSVCVYCLVCDKELEVFGPGYEIDNIASEIEKQGTVGMLSGACICETNGNYGSAVFDDMSGREKLEFYVCDDCLKAKQDKINFVRTEEVIKTHTTMTFGKYRDYDRNEYGKKDREVRMALDKLLVAVGLLDTNLITKMIFRDAVYPILLKHPNLRVVIGGNDYNFYFPDHKVGIKTFIGNNEMSEIEMAKVWVPVDGDRMIPALGHRCWISHARWPDSKKGRELVGEEVCNALGILK